MSEFSYGHDLPVEFQLDLERQRKRQALADLMLSRGLQPLQTQVIGHRAIPISPLQGAGQLAQVAVGVAGQRKGDETYKDIGNRYNTGLASAVQNFNRTRGGISAQEEVPASVATDEFGTAMPPAVAATAATPGDPRKAIQEALVSQYGPVRDLGRLEFQHQAKQEDIKAQRELALKQAAYTLQENHNNRLQQIDLAEASRRYTKEEADNRRAEAQAAHDARHAELMKELKGMGSAGGAVFDVVRPDGRVVKTDRSGKEYGISPADTKIQGAYNQDTASRDSAMAKLDAMSVQAQRVLQHPGLPGAVGLRGAIPNIPGTDAANARADLDTLKNQVGLAALQELRNMSKTGGALGQVTEGEHKILQNSMESLQTSQDLKQFKTRLNSLLAQIEATKDRIRNAYNVKHGITSEGGAAPTAAPQPPASRNYGAPPAGAVRRVD